jgi:hypothetical protein
MLTYKRAEAAGLQPKPATHLFTKGFKSDGLLLDKDENHLL